MGSCVAARQARIGHRGRTLAATHSLEAGSSLTYKKKRSVKFYTERFLYARNPPALCKRQAHPHELSCKI
ncbi:MAG: hypothetical protein FWF77_10345 [Defluviitaleaceae bacterium]|nr:hypothetical protein [Defluviitaleaceae bacterium]